METQKYALSSGEKIVYKASRVRHGFWGAYTNVLIITNQGVILEKYGILDNFKGFERYDYSIINQAIQGKASNGEKQLELYIGNNVEDFALQSGDDSELKVLVMAVNDQMKEDDERFDFGYYQDILTELKESNRILKLRARAREEDYESESANLKIAEAAAINLLKSGDFSAKGIKKAVKKAKGKQKKNSVFSDMMDDFLDASGIRDIQDEFTEMGNEIREGFGLQPKMTHADKKELERLEEKRRKQEISHQKEMLFEDIVTQRRTKSDCSAIGEQNVEPAKMSIKEQMELLQQAKALLDAGILTQSEFDKKKQEILNS